MCFMAHIPNVYAYLQFGINAFFPLFSKSWLVYSYEYLARCLAREVSNLVPKLTFTKRKI